MQPSDICSAVLVSTGNLALREPSRAPWDDVEALMGLALRASSPQPSRVLVVDDAHGERSSFQDWLSTHASPSARLWLVPRPLPPSHALPAPLFSALDPSGLHRVLLSDGPRSTLLLPRAFHPPRYTFTGAQLLAFLRGRPRASAHEAALARIAGTSPGLPLQVALDSLSPEELDDVLARFLPLGASEEADAAGESPDEDALASWNAFFAPAPGSEALSFEYLATRPGEAISPERDVPAARARLASALASARDFSARLGLHSWRKHFARCLLRLSLEPQPLDDFSELLLLNGLPTPAAQLATCAFFADVFGGPDSWNALSFSGPEEAEYRALSERLFSAVHAALRASLNCSAG